MKITYLKNIKQPDQFKPVDLSSLMHSITTGGKFKPQIQAARSAFEFGDYDKYQELKLKLPALAFNGFFKEKITNANFVESSELFHFDIDHVDPLETKDKLQRLFTDSLVFCYSSPSGHGVKGAIRINKNLVGSDADFKRVFEAFNFEFTKQGIQLDGACKDVRRLSFISYDPAAYFNPNTNPFPLVLTEPVQPVFAPQSINPPTRTNSSQDARFCEQQIRNMFFDAVPGQRHHTRLKAGRLAGGLVAAGRITEGEAMAILVQESDRVSDKGKTTKAEFKTLEDAFSSGLSDPAHKKQSESINDPRPSDLKNESIDADEEENRLLNPPPVMDPAGFHGILEEVCHIATRTSEASPVAVAANVLATFSAMIGRVAFQHIGDGVCHARPFFLLTGRTGKARKGTSEYTPYRIFKEVENQLGEDFPKLKRHEGGLSTGEGLGWALRDPMRDDDDELIDEGVQDKRLYVSEAEFAGALASAAREKNNLSATIRNAWDGRDISPLVKNARWCASSPHICITGHITASELISRMSEVDAQNGFMNRFVILHIARPKLVPMPERTPDADIQRVAKVISEAVLFSTHQGAFNNNELQIKLSPAAIKLWCAEYHELTREINGIAGSLLVRTEIYCRMFSMIFALLDKSELIEPIHIKSALAWIKYWKDSVNYIFGAIAARVQQERLDERAKDIHQFITISKGCTRTDITRKYKNKYTANEITAALNQLLNAAPPLIKQQEQERSDGKPGRPVLKFWAV